jgi:hypothetical protein
MGEFPAEVAKIPLDANARRRITNESKWFNRSLTLQAKLHAHYDRHDKVLDQHVREAMDSIMRHRRPKPIWHEAVPVLGGILSAFGAQNLIAELSDPHRVPRLVVYVACIAVGIVMILAPRVVTRG